MYSGYPQLAFNFCKNFSARMHRSSLGKAILKLCLHSSITDKLLVQNNFMSNRLTQNSRDCTSFLFNGQTSRPYSSTCTHIYS